MKQLLLIAAAIFLICIITITSCKKEKGITAELNKAPVANAGADTTITVLSCDASNATVTLNGRSSSDPENNITNYSWVKISGPDGIVIRDPTSVKTLVERMSVGLYAFQLTVQDEFGKVSRDTVNVTARGPAKEFDLDITASTEYTFIDNYEEYYYGTGYNDVTILEGTTTFQPIGELNFYVSEYSDTAALSNVHDTYIYIHEVSGTAQFVGGTTTVNFKKLIREGGGSFSGTFTPLTGSAQVCGDELNTLSPLIVTGNLDVNTNTATITIKGKIYF